MIDFRDIHVFDNIITNIYASRKLTNLLLENYFPKPNNPSYHHYTSISAFESIVQNNSLWLFSVEKRYKEDEFTHFYSVHGMDGYKKRLNSKRRPLEEDIVHDVFYISLTDDNLELKHRDYMWDYFAEKHTGVNIRFCIDTKYTGFRKVGYPTDNIKPEIPLLKELVDESLNKFNRLLILEQIMLPSFHFLIYLKFY